MSQERGMYGASKPMRPPEVKASRKDLRSEQRGENGLWRLREEMLHFGCWRYL